MQDQKDKIEKQGKQMENLKETVKELGKATKKNEEKQSQKLSRIELVSVASVCLPVGN